MGENDLHFVAGAVVALFTVACLYLFAKIQDR